MWHRAKILSRRQLSPSVTGLTLQVDGLREFLPGQWLDFRPRPSPAWEYADEDKVPIGGYSITSIPQSLPRLDLAVQSSRHPVATWVTNHARPDDFVDVRVGGSFAYRRGDCNAAGAAANSNILFIAGGVGINPLFSMIQQWHLEKNERSRAILLYSARERTDLLFLEELRTLVGRDAKDARDTGRESNISFREGRLELDVIRDAVWWLNNNAGGGAMQSQTKIFRGDDSMVADDVFVCGPPGMPESMIEILSKEKLVRSADDINFEKWW
ncbi:hypothetical protein ACHAXT_011070 [Thalassiosira profunda]